MFRSDMERQYLKLMDMIAAIVGTLDKHEMFQSIIRHSGRQHAQFGAKPLHFAAFGKALIWGLEQQFGAAFTPEMKEAWIKLYDDVQREMVRAGDISEELAAPP
jgi:hemoglobin-like flavoprotein